MAEVLPLLVYGPLVQPRRFISDDLAFKMGDLKMTPAAWGGYWSLTFPIVGQQHSIEDWIEDGLGRHVELYSPGLAPIFEGFVSEVSADIGGYSMTIGPLLDTCANRIRCAYAPEQTDVGAVGMRTFTAWNNDTTSQGKYGIIERVLTTSASSQAEAEQIRDITLTETAAPERSERDNLGSSVTPRASITCLGYSHWLKAYTYENATTGTSAADVKIQAVLTADPNGLFSTDYSYVTANAGTTPATQETERRTAWNIIQGIVALGDTAFNRWVFGLYKNRKAWYNAITDTTKYARRLSAPRQSLEGYTSGVRVHPWDVQPAEWVFYTDLLTGALPGATRRRDSRYLFIEEGNYQVPWALTLNGAKVSKLDQMLNRMGLGGST